MTDHELDEMMNAFCGMGPAMARMKAAEAKWDALVPAGAKAFVEWARTEEKAQGFKNTGAKAKLLETWVFGNPPALADDERDWAIADVLFRDCVYPTKTRTAVLRFLAGACAFDEVAKTAREEAPHKVWHFPAGMRSLVEPTDEQLREHARQVAAHPEWFGYISAKAEAFLAGDPNARAYVFDSFQLQR